MSRLFPRVQAEAFRRRRNFWIAYGSEAAAPLLRGIASVASRGSTSAPAEWHRGLIIGHNHIGDVLYRTASLERLANALPDCRWSYLTSEGSAGLLRDNPYVAEVLPWMQRENSWSLAKDDFAAMRSRKFDVALCSNTLRHLPDLGLAVALGIPNRVAFANKGLTGLITHEVSPAFPQPYPAYFRTMVASVTGSHPDWELRPRLFLSDADRAQAAAAWNRLGLPADGPVLACVLSTRQSSGNWPADILLTIAERARRKLDFEVVICGAASDRHQLEALAKTAGFPARVLAGETSVTGLAAFFERCSALLTLDSGPRHIGNAVHIPVVFARNLSHSRIEAGAYCDTETDLAPDVEYLSDREVETTTLQLDVDRMADVVVGRLRVSGSRA